jgi:hypothetical protein
VEKVDFNVLSALPISFQEIPILMANRVHGNILKQFREELYSEGILHDGDTIGTNDGTLLYV